MELESNQHIRIDIFHNNSLVKKMAFVRGVSTSITIGKINCDIEIQEPTLSRKHAEIFKNEKDEFYITDLNSTNGIFLNNKKIEPNAQVYFKKGDILSFSSSHTLQMLFHSTSNSHIKSEKNPKQDQVDGISSTSILEKFKDKSIITIGRSSSCDVVINHSSISRQHASIEKKGTNTFILKDLESLNGTFLNGKRITTSVKVTENDSIFIGRFRLSLRGKASDLSTEVALRVDRIAKQFSNGKVGLHPCSFEIPSKTLMAVMGPSGCGKSTLLKALNGDSPPTQGKVYISGLDLSKQYDYLKTQIGYVPQDDIVHRELTVEQSIYYAAKLRLENASKEQIRSKIEKVLFDLKIQGIRNEPVGKISGGQRKRVSIAVEILTDPLVLFLDEPTSPLDPQTIEEFLGILRKLAENGTTVIMVTHKPEDLNYMDSVIFMAEGGHLVFNDNAKKYLSYFNVDDTVKVYSSLVKEKAKFWIEQYRKNHPLNPSPVSAPVIVNTSSTNYFSQYGWLTMRYFNIKLNDRLNTALMLGQAPIIASLICLIFNEINLAVPFLIAVSAIWFGTNNAAREIVSETPIFKRERMFNQGIFPYIFSKITVLTSFAAIQCFLFIAIISIVFANKEPNWFNPVLSYVWMLTLSISASLMGLLLSAIVTSTEKVMTLVPLVLIPQIMLAGVVAKIDNKIVEVLSYLSLSRWGTEGFAIVQEKVAMPDIALKEGTGIPDQNGTIIPPEMEEVGVKSAQAMEELSANFHAMYSNFFGSWSSTFKLDLVVVTCISLFFFATIYIALKRKDSMKIK